MCRPWQWLVQRVAKPLNPTARTQAATGSGAKPDADDLEIPQNLDDGSSDMTDEVIEQARRDVHDAIEQFMRLAFPGVLVTTDWLLIAEDVMSDDEETRVLHPAISANNTSWKILGMTAAAVRHFSGATY